MMHDRAALDRGLVRSRSSGGDARRSLVVTVAVLIGALSMLALGTWAFLAPGSFADFVDYTPYNRHLVHDAGAFQVGIGVSLVAGLVGWDGVLVALTGFAAASGLHTLSHHIDRHIGGHDSDVPTLGLLTLVALVAIAAHVPWRRS